MDRWEDGWIDGCGRRERGMERWMYRIVFSLHPRNHRVLKIRYAKLLSPILYCLSRSSKSGLWIVKW